MFNSILIFISILIVYMACYSSFDLFQLVKNREKNSRFLFLASTFTIGFGFWILSFIDMMITNVYATANYNIPITILSMVVGICFSGMAFYALLDKEKKKRRIYVSAFFFSLSLLSVSIIGFYSIGSMVYYQIPQLFISFILLYIGFWLSIWLSFYPVNIPVLLKKWIRPLCSLLMTSVCMVSHFILLSNISAPEISVAKDSYESSFIIYIALFVSVLVLGGLIGTSTLIGERIDVGTIDVRDMQHALDESAIVAFTDNNGMITYANDKFVELSKYSREELLGQNHRIVNSGHHSPEFFRELWNTINKGEIWRGEILNKAKDGTLYWVDTVIVPFLNKEGSPYQYVAIRRDITEQKNVQLQLEESVREVSDITYALEQSSIIAFTDKRGIITKVNSKFCEISGYTREELIGKTHRIVNSGYHSKEFFRNVWQTIAQGEIWKGEIRNKRKDGTYYWVDTTIVPFLDKNNKPYQYLAIRNDITEKKRTEEVLHRQDKLAAVGQLAAGVAHEIRNPLTSIKGYAEFLSMDETEKDRQEYFDIILDEIERVNSIVEEFMLLSKPTVSVLERKPLLPIIDNVVSILDYQLRKSKIKLNRIYEEPNLFVECDENKLKQVFLNFIKNAVEAMPNGGSIEITVKREDEDITIMIKDSGIGMSKEQIKKLGEPFFTTKKDGNGLGLMVSFKIIENLNGKVYIDSEQNKGTSFHITLPSVD
ncbi:MULTISPECIES: PAS domain S-box protein [Niallia]|uniref:PAS domain S-box protein n=1 Tax=Niallia TaxID=2837506 RepID=UPI0020C1A9EF|nr:MULTISPECIES: PAS domain S-box protein [Niallia]MDU1843967.1 PAS domain S-box protein [Niallia nealsonii]MED3794108.1 PAS domain S-box protein [Niallia alba]UTI40957.1 PAS domain S-box protein [Niallia sp. RD1]